MSLAELKAEGVIKGAIALQPQHEKDINELVTKFGEVSAARIISSDGKVKDLLIQVNAIPKTPAGDKAGQTLSQLFTGHPDVVDRLNANLTDASAQKIIEAAKKDPAGLDRALPKLLAATNPADFALLANTITTAPTQSFAKANPPKAPEGTPAPHTHHTVHRSADPDAETAGDVPPSTPVAPVGNAPASTSSAGNSPAAPAAGGDDVNSMILSFAAKPGFKEFMEQKLGVKVGDDGKLVVNPAADPKFADLRTSLGIDKLTSSDAATSAAQSAKLKPLLAKIDEEVTNNPNFFVKMNTMMDKRPQMASMLAGTLQDNPDLAMQGIEMLGKFDQLHTVISGLFSHAEPGSFMATIGGFVEKLFSGMEDMVNKNAPMLAGLSGGPSSGNGGGLLSMLGGLMGGDATPSAPAAGMQQPKPA